MKTFNDLTDDQKKELQTSLQTLNNVAKAYTNFGREKQSAAKHSKDPDTYLKKNFNQIFTVAKDYGIKNNLMNLGSVQDELNSVANTAKRLAVYPNAILHQVIDDVVTVASDFDGSSEHWLDNAEAVVQDGHCLKNDVDEIKTSFKMN